MHAQSTYQSHDLLLLVARGDEKAYRQLYDLHRNRIFSLSYLVTKNKTLAEDVLQEVFIKIWVNRHQLPDLESFPAWLRTVTRNLVYNKLRRLATEETYLREVTSTGNPEGTENTRETVAANELQRILHQAVGQLSVQQRKVYIMAKEEGLRYEEIAKALNISRDTVKYHMTEALNSIRRYLQHQEHQLVFFLLLAADKIIE